MGVDLATYRARIGCCRNNNGNDVLTVLVTVNVSVVHRVCCLLLTLAIGVLGLLHGLQYVLQSEVDVLNSFKTNVGVFCITGFLYNRKDFSILTGALWFLYLLLLASGVEPNPGPLSTTKELHSSNSGLTASIIEFSLLLKSLFSCISGQTKPKEEVTCQQYQCVSDTESNTSNNSVPSLSYLLGNKGAHMVNGNPHNEGDTSLTKDTTSLLEKGVQDSIAFITITEVTEGHTVTYTGTGFRVGDSHLMTAYHVFRDKINKLKETIVFCAPEYSPDFCNKLGIEFDDHDHDLTKANAVRKFFENNAVDIPLILNRLGDTTANDVASLMRGKWEKDCKVEFLHHGTFTVGWEVPFGHEDTDILILPLIPTTRQQCMPRPLFLNEHFDVNNNYHIVRYINQDSPKVVLDAKCQVFKDDDALAKDVHTALEWWVSYFSNERDKISYEECSKAHDRETGRVILRAAASFVYGSSGSPIVYVDSTSRQIYAGMVYQGGYPTFYYLEEEAYNDKIKNKTKKNINDQVLFERSTTIEKFSELLTLFRKSKLKKMLFNAESIQLHIMKDKVRDEIRLSDKHDRLFDKACMNSEYTRLLTRQWEKDEEFFIETTASRHICKEVETSSILSIVGTSGSGKSFCMHHVALKLQRHGFTLFVIRDCSSIYRLIKSDVQKQLFLVDDPVGEDEIDQQLFQEWKRYSKDFKEIFKESNKLLMTVRTEIMNSLDKSASIFTEKIINLHSTGLEMTGFSRTNYFEEAVKKRNIGIPLNDSIWKMVKECNLQNFVLLVHMYCADNYFRQNPSDLFVEPLGAFSGRLEQMWKVNSKQFGGLVLCSIYDARLSASIFDPFDSELTDGKQKAKELLEKLSIYCNLQDVGNDVEKLQGVYIHKSKSQYTFKHSSFKNIVLYTVAKKYINFILDNCDTKFCLNRCLLSREPAQVPCTILTQNDAKYKIEIPETMEDRLASKFILNSEENRDIATEMYANRISYDTQFLMKIVSAINTQVKDEHFRMQSLYQVFCNACLVKAFELREKLKNSIDNFSHTCFTGLTPLIACSYAEDIKEIEYLLANKCDVNVSGNDNYETTPLCVASKLGNLSIVRLLLDHGAKINQYDGKGITPLTWSVYNDENDIMLFLLEKGADVNICGDSLQAESPLTVASQNGSKDIVNTLLTHNAEVTLLNGKGNTPITGAAGYNHIDIIKLLLDRGSDVNLCGDKEQSETPLIAACYNGYVDIVNVLLFNGVEINKMNGLGRTAITEAAFHNHIDIVKLLLDHDADINLCCDKDQSLTPLTAACNEGYVDIVNMLLCIGVEINKRNSRGRTAITEAAFCNHIDIVKLLLDHGCDVNLCGDKEQSYTPLTAACLYGYVDIVNVLLRNGVEINKMNCFGRTAIADAAIGNHIDIIKLLLDHGADINLCDDKEQSYTPLRAACYYGYVDIVNVLLCNGVEINKMNGLGRTAISEAAFYNHIDIVKLLLDHGCDVNICGDKEQSYTPLTAAGKKGYVEIVNVLLRNGVDINKMNCFGRTAIAEAAFGNHIDIVKLLLEHGSDVNLCGDKEQAETPLTAACYKGSVDIVNILLCFGVEINKMNGLGRTAISEAAFYNHIDIVKLLLDHDADINLCCDKDKSLTPLTAAGKKGYVDIVNMLLCNGVDINKMNGRGTTAIAEAAFGNHIDIVKLLLDHGSDVNLCGDKEQAETPLTAACNKGSVDIVNVLLCNGVEINKMNGGGRTAIAEAAFGNHIDIVKLLLDHGSDVNLCGDKEQAETPLTAACYNGSVDIANVLLCNCVEINKMNGLGRTAITEAAIGNQVDILKLLLDHDADVNLCGDKEQAETPLTAACHKGSVDIVNILLCFGVEINKMNGLGRTAITEAAIGNQIDILKLLLDHDADVNLCGDRDQSYTPLAGACYEGYLDIVNVLFCNGAETNKMNGLGRTAITDAAFGNHIYIVKLLLDHGSDINLCGDKVQSLTPLTGACYKGYVDIANVLLCNGVEINKMNGGGRTAIAEAAFGNHIDIVKLLLDHGSDVNLCGDKEQAETPLTGACYNGYVDIANVLLCNGVEINKMNGGGRTAIAEAAFGNHIDIVKLLLDHGSDVNLCGDKEQAETPLTAACYKGSVDIANVLLCNCVEINKMNGLGRTAITEAAFGNHINIVKLLLDNGADFNLCGDKEQSLTPLTAACTKGFIDIVKMLLYNGVEINKMNGRGRAAITGASLGNHIDIVKLLLDHGSDVNLCGDKEQAETPLTAACYKGSVDIVNVLLCNSVEINQMNGLGRTAITEAALGNHIDIVKLLLDHGADVNLCSDKDQSYTPLTAACYKGYVDIVNMSLCNGVEINKMNGRGRTAITEAAFGNHIDIVKLLLDHGADVNLCSDKEQSYTPLTAACYKGYVDIVNILLGHTVKINQKDGFGSTPIEYAVLYHHTELEHLLKRNLQSMTITESSALKQLKRSKIKETKGKQKCNIS